MLGALGLAATLAGCAGSNRHSERQAATSVARRWTQALLDDDGATACPLMLRTAQRELAGMKPTVARKGCSVYIATIVGVNVNGSAPLISKPRIAGSQVSSFSGNYAVAAVRIGYEGATTTIHVVLRRTARGWRVSGYGLCAKSDERSCGRVAPGDPRVIETATPAAVTKAGGHRLTEFEAGKKAVAQSGCLACHRIGENGNTGPGRDLTKVGDRLPKQTIARTLVNPTAPMPSFRHLPAAKFHAIVTFLAELK
jgi:Cytochrome c